MGAWGAGLYSDDTTCEVRDAYKENLKHGLSDTEAYERILDGYGGLIGDDEVACLVYFALADTSWKFGRLHNSIRSKALELLGHGGDIAVWERDAPAEVTARKKVLRTLEQRLLSEQPVPKAIEVSKPKPKKFRTNLPVGSVFALSLPSANRALLVLVGFLDLGKSVDPVFSVLDWRGEDAPSQLTLDQAARKDTIPIQSGLGKQAHWSIFVKDERKNVMSCLEQTSLSVTVGMPFDPDQVVFSYVEALAREIDAHFAAT
ncbi:hypothetical protein SAMN05518865_11639 [Duganella sp. CF458]|uniref:hypothetical protein n=1 Tax=Duganella sp. CF458 TaxID=1884368 RepID=UPI0008F4163F|nr:hypothetical protein [Duganella sp. CF458]SFG68664.1 hypothetical protein SAMN05518865_11639 [Duganella sp. CF458]